MTSGTDSRSQHGRLLVIGASAGGVDALQRVVAALPADLEVPVLITLHLGSGSPGLLAGILARRSTLPVVGAEDGVPLRAGRIVVAQPDVHLAVVDGEVRLGRGARENHHRPSVDVLFRSAALSHGPGVVAVVLTGMLDDGAAGLRAVVDRGGTALVQDPDDAEFPGMPAAALAAVPSARALPLSDLVTAVVDALRTEPDPAPHGEAHRRLHDEAELRAALGLDPHLPDGGLVGVPSSFSCPDCGGVLREVEDGTTPRFRCRTGHAYSAQSLLESQAETVEEALYTAVRALEERADLAERLARSAGSTGRSYSQSHFRQRAAGARSSVEVLRRLLDDPSVTGTVTTEAG